MYILTYTNNDNDSDDSEINVVDDDHKRPNTNVVNPATIDILIGVENLWTVTDFEP